jgi:hypothetical protein
MWRPYTETQLCDGPGKFNPAAGERRLVWAVSGF